MNVFVRLASGRIGTSEMRIVNFSSIFLRQFSMNEENNVRQYFSKMYESLATEEVKPKESSMSCRSHVLMLYNGLLYPSHTGAFHFSPMALRALNKLKRITCEAMNRIGAEELSLSTISRGDLWQKSGRWETTGSELFKLKDRHEVDYCLGPTYEEVITSLVASNRTISHKKLPIMLYQITRKFRDEMAPKYGLLRGREFEMKDLYTFDTSEANAKITYEKVCLAYEQLFDRLDLKYAKVVGSTGNIGGSLSHEYHIPADIGQDNLINCNSCSFASNEELLEQTISNCPDCGGQLTKTKGIEIGHSFLLGTKYSKIFKANYVSDKRKPELMEMGCYGIGVTRLLAASIEVLSSENEIKWPRLIAPYQICIIPQKDGYKSEITSELSEQLYDSITNLPNLSCEVIIDDRTKFSIGKRVIQAKQIGYPYLITVGRHALEDTPKYEFIDVYNDRIQYLDQNELLKILSVIKTVIA